MPGSTPACFSLQAPFTFGNSDGTACSRLDTRTSTSAFRSTCRWRTARGIQLRWEVFNVLNRTNFDVPNRIAFTPNFGRIFSAQPARQMQLGVKVIF